MYVLGMCVCFYIGRVCMFVHKHVCVCVYVFMYVCACLYMWVICIYVRLINIFVGLRLKDVRLPLKPDTSTHIKEL